MRRQDFYYDLPPDLIAQHPPAERSASRMLHVEPAAGRFHDRMFADLPTLVRPGDLLVFNDTRVIPARLHGVKSSGGRVEVLVERILDEHRVLVHVRASKAPKAGTRLRLEDAVDARVLGRHDDLFELQFDDARPVLAILDTYGHVPLPPYIERADAAEDRERYQTVFARAPGAVAAPTAGLHFDVPMMEALEKAGIASAYVTLHVGAGTFQPVRADNIEQHRMHSEYVEVPSGVCEQIERTRSGGGRVIAVGTTVVRSLETAAREGECAPFAGETDIFIYPGYHFRVIDGLITNFHLPESSLLMLVCALAGYDLTMRAYRHAVDERYRFFSYGDAMLILQ